ncbi:HpcH/HpaI aldolase family protein [Rhodococcus pyridinivorans]|uniref:HpcH/HpaI aldolase family protein n=1 Tax=Rhodococcus pyridinivorans TaxID=103816 RepID=UPI0015869953|nr:aldolase/citrate lyase family protein [Rhodococcus pyridinivorans]
MSTPANNTHQVPNRVRDTLRRGEVATVLSIRLVRTPEIVLLARAAGFDGVFVDLEHSTIASDAVSHISLTALAAGLTPLVHVRSAYSESIGPCLDGGALGIIVPHVDSAQEGRAAVAAARYPPRGNRGVSSALPFFDFRSISSDTATAAVDMATLVIAMIESQEALDNVDEIAALDGVDVLMIGANDLTADLGVPGDYGGHLAQAAFRRVIGAAEAAGRFAGVGGVPAESGELRDLVQAGARFVSAGVDLRHLGRAITSWNDHVRTGD